MRFLLIKNMKNGVFLKAHTQKTNHCLVKVVKESDGMKFTIEVESKNENDINEVRALAKKLGCSYFCDAFDEKEYSDSEP